MQVSPLATSQRFSSASVAICRRFCHCRGRQNSTHFGCCSCSYAVVSVRSRCVRLIREPRTRSIAEQPCCRLAGFPGINCRCCISSTGLPNPGAWLFPCAHQTIQPVHLQGFPSNAITFEAWLSTSDFCHVGELDMLAVFSCTSITDVSNKGVLLQGPYFHMP